MMSLVRGMPLQPHACINCGSLGEMEDDGPPMSVFCEGVDVNWGDSVYLCVGCAQIAGKLVGLIDGSRQEDQERALRKITVERDALIASNEDLADKLDKIVQGRRTTKEVRDAHKAVN